MTEESLPQISFRSLKQGYRLAESHPEDWHELFAGTLPEVNVDLASLVLELAKLGLKTKDQTRIFEEKTGLKERSFYLYRREAKLTSKRTPMR